jgi:hypothetical protein
MAKVKKKFEADVAELAKSEHEKGVSFRVIADQFGISSSHAMDLIKKHFGIEAYDDCIKEARLSRKRISEALTADIVLRGRQKIHQMLVNGEVVDVKDCCMIEKTYGDRVAIANGEATESIKQVATMRFVLSEKTVKELGFDESGICPKVD